MAIGETGLDYYHLEEGKEEDQKRTQKAFFAAQVQLAQQHSLPVIIHTRNAAADTLACMKEFSLKKFVIHCFTEDLAFAEEILKISDESYVSFSGIITYNKSDAIRQVAKQIPLGRILIETDAPFLAPQAFRGQTNQSAFTREVLNTIIALRTEDQKTIEDTIFANSLRFFGIPSDVKSIQ